MTDFPTGDESVDASYFAERYHRVFDEEGAALVALLCERTPPGPDLLHALVTGFRGVLSDLGRHQRAQEESAFPRFVRGDDDDALFAACVEDLATVADGVDAARGVTLVIAAARAEDAALLRRVLHFFDEVDRHLDEELRAFQAWSV